jgi:hypothetical protein
MATRLLEHDANATVFTATSYTYAGENAMEAHLSNLMDDYMYTTRLQRSLKKRINHVLKEREAEANKKEEQAKQAWIVAKRERENLKNSNALFKERMKQAETLDYEDEDRHSKAEEWVAENHLTATDPDFISPLFLNPSVAPTENIQLEALNQDFEAKPGLTEEIEQEIRLIEGIRETEMDNRRLARDSKEAMRRIITVEEKRIQMPKQFDDEAAPSIVVHYAEDKYPRTKYVGALDEEHNETRDYNKSPEITIHEMAKEITEKSQIIENAKREWQDGYDDWYVLFSLEVFLVDLMNLSRLKRQV